MLLAASNLVAQFKFALIEHDFTRICQYQNEQPFLFSLFSVLAQGFFSRWFQREKIEIENPKPFVNYVVLKFFHTKLVKHSDAILLETIAQPLDLVLTSSRFFPKKAEIKRQLFFISVS